MAAPIADNCLIMYMGSDDRQEVFSTIELAQQGASRDNKIRPSTTARAQRSAQVVATIGASSAGSRRNIAVGTNAYRGQLPHCIGTFRHAASVFYKHNEERGKQPDDNNAL